MGPTPGTSIEVRAMFRSDVVGSLLRPAYLSEARKQVEAGQIDARAFKAIEDRAVDEALRLQEEPGLDVLTGGEIEELVRLGCTYVQIDAPQYGALLDPKMREGYRQRGSDVDEMIDRTIELDNAVIEGFGQQGVTFGLHICRGNNQSM